MGQFCVKLMRLCSLRDAHTLAACQIVGMPFAQLAQSYVQGFLGREIPSFCIRNCGVGRFIPSRAAAPFGPAKTQLVCSRTDRICFLSTSSRVATPFA